MLKQNDILFWYSVGSPLCVKILKRNQLRTTELEINQQGGMWREMRGDRKRKREGYDLSREKCYTGWSVWAWQHRPPQKAESPFTISTFSFIRSLPPHLLLSVWNRLVMIPFSCRQESRSPQPYLIQAHIYTRTHTHNHIFTPLHSPLSLTYTQP